MLKAKWCRCVGTSLLKNCCACFHKGNMVLGKNHYDTLGVSKSSSLAEIKRAYFRLCKEYHPDRYPGNDVKLREFHKINDAYTVLSNTESRRKYDHGIEKLRRHRDIYHESYSSAFRGNPYVRQGETHVKWDKFYSNQMNRENFERPRPKDRLERYWDDYYRYRNSSGKAGARPPSWFLPDRMVSFVITFIITLLLMRMIAAGLALNSRAALEQKELQRHYEVQKRAEEAKARIKEKHSTPKSESNFQDKLDEA